MRACTPGLGVLWKIDSIPFSCLFLFLFFFDFFLLYIRSTVNTHTLFTVSFLSLSLFPSSHPFIFIYIFRFSFIWIWVGRCKLLLAAHFKPTHACCTRLVFFFIILLQPKHSLPIGHEQISMEFVFTGHRAIDIRGNKVHAWCIHTHTFQKEAITVRKWEIKKKMSRNTNLWWSVRQWETESTNLFRGHWTYLWSAKAFIDHIVHVVWPQIVGIK